MSVINTPPLASPMVEKFTLTAERSWLNWVMQAYRILFDVQNYGTTALRPTTNLYVGKPYFDTTLGYGILYNGSAWVRWDGVVV